MSYKHISVLQQSEGGKTECAEWCTRQLCLEVRQRISIREKDNTRRKEKDITHQTRAESFNITKRRVFAKVRPSQLVELSRSEFDPELFSQIQVC